MRLRKYNTTCIYASQSFLHKHLLLCNTICIYVMFGL
nr:MAG TPA: hypothetical protein [Caudoviricetes sp.]